MSVLNLSWGVPVMDRLNKVHRVSRVMLPQSIVDHEVTGSATLSLRRFWPMLPRYIGLFGFVTGGTAVIVTASLIALSIK